MRIYFTEEQKQQELHKIEVEDILFLADKVEGEGKNYVLTGSAVVDGETYHDFQIEFETVEVPADETVEAIMDMDWDWYDYKFD